MNVNFGGPFEDRRPWYTVAVTGRPDLIPGGLWQTSVLARGSFEQPGAADVCRYLDACLWKKRASHRLMIRCRGGDDEAGIDTVVREYAASRKLHCVPLYGSAEQYGRDADFRRDLLLVADSHALVWFGPREAGGIVTGSPDPVTLALWLGIPCRVVPLGAPAVEEV